MLNGVERDDTFDAIVGRDTLLGGQRPSGRSAPVSTDQEPAGKEEMPIFQNSLAYIEKIDEAFGKLVLPALLEF